MEKQGFHRWAWLVVIAAGEELLAAITSSD